jgi:hypothetical protein
VSSVHLPLVARFLVAGAIWKVSTNCREILSTMHDVFEPKDHDFVLPELKLCLYVDADLPDYGRKMLPHFRALESLYYGTFGPGDSMVVDQHNRRVVGSYSLATARDGVYWKRVILPCLVGITSACLGVTPVHCACVVRIHDGLLIHGESGSGKSTLALSLSLNGFSYLADDCTYVSSVEQKLRCWGSSAPLKLLPESVTFFPRLANVAPSQSLNGEIAFEVDPTETFGVRRSSACEPRWLVFLERTGGSNASFTTLSRTESASRIASDLEILPPCLAGQRDQQLRTIDTLVQRECCLLRHGLQPEAAALAIAEFCSRN